MRQCISWSSHYFFRTSDPFLRTFPHKDLSRSVVVPINCCVPINKKFSMNWEKVIAALVQRNSAIFLDKSSVLRLLMLFALICGRYNILFILLKFGPTWNAPLNIFYHCIHLFPEAWLITSWVYFPLLFNFTQNLMQIGYFYSKNRKKIPYVQKGLQHYIVPSIYV